MRLCWPSIWYLNETHAWCLCRSRKALARDFQKDNSGEASCWSYCWHWTRYDAGLLIIMIQVHIAFQSFVYLFSSCMIGQFEAASIMKRPRWYSCSLIVYLVCRQASFSQEAGMHLLQSLYIRNRPCRDMSRECYARTECKWRPDDNFSLCEIHNSLATLSKETQSI